LTKSPAVHQPNRSATAERGPTHGARDAAMNLHSGLGGSIPFRKPAETLGSFDPDTAAQVAVAAGDITFILDREGVIRDVAMGDPDMAQEGFGDWIDRPWIDTVTSDSRPKVEEMLRDAGAKGKARWRQVNHASPQGGSVPVRYLTMNAGQDGRMLAIGRDLRGMAMLQQKLLQAQQAMERDYMRLRQTEARYRLLFEASSEAVMVVDAATRKITECNPAALALTGGTEAGVIGRALTALVSDDSRDAVVGLLGAVVAAGQTAGEPVRLANDGVDCTMSATLFRQDRAAYFFIRLTPVNGSVAATPEPRTDMIAVLDRMPDAFVMTDGALNIIAENAAFLELAQLNRTEEARGQPLARYLGRPGIDLNVLVAHLSDHGAVRNFATILRGEHGSEDEVEVSAVAVADRDQPCMGFSIRNVSRRLNEVPVAGRELPRSVEQLTELVGRVSLKEIVRESTDLIERLCIEAALNYTADNRASAADILGLSRQSLYSKLHRHGLGNLAPDGG
jgi:transcriptional regulator PpsR